MSFAYSARWARTRMMNLLIMHRVGEAKNQEGRTTRKQTRGDEIRPPAKAFDVVLSSDHGAVSVRDIGDDNED